MVRIIYQKLCQSVKVCVFYTLLSHFDKKNTSFCQIRVSKMKYAFSISNYSRW